LTIFEAISASGKRPIPPFVVVEGQHVMMDWVAPGSSDLDIHIETSEKGFTTNEIALNWLYHFIRHTGSDASSPWKLLLMDNHGSHETPEFIRLANSHNILPYPLLPHSSHFMQPCDCGPFGAYKYWQNHKVNDAVTHLDVEYHIRSFIKDLPWVREKTFARETIKSAFNKTGMYPPSVT
jgi:hypothetical protein